MGNTTRNDSIIDSLFSSEPVNTVEEQQEIYLPKRCKRCRNAVICNILAATIGFSRIGVLIEVAACPYFPHETNESK